MANLGDLWRYVF